jgi:hypothetical protein
MQKMRVQVHDVRIELVGEHQRLTETTHPIGRRIPSQIAQPCVQAVTVSAPAAYVSPGGDYPSRRTIEVFGKVMHGSANLTVNRMPPGIGGVAQGYDAYVQAALFQGPDFVGDEGFRQTRITLDDEGDRAGPWPCLQ